MDSYTITINCVDDSVMEFKSADASAVYDYLKCHDHEGSAITLKIEKHDPDMIYGFFQGMISKPKESAQAPIKKKVAKGNSSEWCHFDVTEIEATSKKAIRMILKSNGRGYWVPRKLVSDGDDFDKGDKDCTVSVKRFFCEKEGFDQFAED